MEMLQLSNILYWIIQVKDNTECPFYFLCYSVTTQTLKYSKRFSLWNGSLMQCLVHFRDFLCKTFLGRWCMMHLVFDYMLDVKLRFDLSLSPSLTPSPPLWCFFFLICLIARKSVRISCVLQVLNQIVFELPEEHPLADTRPLRELLGHTPPQVWLDIKWIAPT